MKYLEPEWWEEWTYYDKEDMARKLKDDAPEEVREEWEEMQAEMGYNEPER